MKPYLTVIVTLLAGCATPGQWTNPDRTPQQAELDSYECRRDGEQYAAGLGFGGNPLIIADRYRDCMRVRGYFWREIVK